MTGNPLFENPHEPDLPVIAYENRPDSRTKRCLYALYKIAFDKNVLDASYRYLTDDWSIDSHTLDVHLRVPVGSRSYWKPQLRLYQQSGAEPAGKFGALSQQTLFPEVDACLVRFIRNF